MLRRNWFPPLLNFRWSTVAIALGALVFGTAELAQAQRNFLVLYKGNRIPTNAADAIQSAGGALVYSYPQIGVAIAQSSEASFSSTLRHQDSVDGVAAGGSFVARAPGAAAQRSAVVAPNAPVNDFAEPFFQFQWNMRQIKVPDAHGITGGSSDVVVGDIDTGVDFAHPDLAANIDFSRSVSCMGGVPDQNPAAWNDDNGHGTHTAGIIAAGANGIGVVGVAPHVKLAAIKAGDADQFFFPEAVVCAFVWAAEHGIAVTNNSYYVDPWLYNCRNDPEQRAIIEAVRRAIDYARAKNVAVVAILHNQSDDLSHPQVDLISPDFPLGSEQSREVTNNCVVLPVELPGVIGVSANGALLNKAWYSNYGIDVVQVVAPGGDSFLQSAVIGGGAILSTYPARFAINEGGIFDPNGGPLAAYAFLEGTSMAAPHVTGIAALMLSRFGALAPDRLQALLTQTADPLVCPANPFLFPLVPRPSGDPQICQGGSDHNSFFGHGQVNAFEAVR